MTYTIHHIERFWEKVNSSEGVDRCWNWTGGCNTPGYGQIRMGDGIKSKRMLSHRVAYELAYGEIPDGLLVCHRCDNPLCCNPTHLFLGTNADNAKDKVSKGRQARGGNISRPGEKHPNHKLNNEKVAYIRSEYATKKKNKAELAREMGVHFGTITFIVNRVTWRHLK